MTAVVAPTRRRNTRRAQSIRVEAVCEQAVRDAKLNNACSFDARSRARSISTRVRPAPIAIETSCIVPLAGSLKLFGDVQSAAAPGEAAVPDDDFILDEFRDAADNVEDQFAGFAITTPPAWKPPPMPEFNGLIPMEVPKAFSQSALPSSPTLISKVLNKLLPLRSPKSALASPAKGSVPMGKRLRTKEQRSPSPPYTRAAEKGEKADSRLRQRRGAHIQEVSGHDQSETAAFRTMLTRVFGNLTLAFRALKSAAQTQKLSSNRGTLNYLEWEWLVTRYLHYGDKHLARRLFDGISNRFNATEITLLELSGTQSIAGGKGESLTLSLLDLRHRLINRFTSLPKAFKELEDYISEQERQEIATRGWCQALVDKKSEIVGQRRLRLGEFIDAGKFFGLDEKQAERFFTLMDNNGDGDLTLDEFMQALTSMPGHILIGDLRDRLLAKHQTVNRAIKELQRDVMGLMAGGELDNNAFAHSMARMGISEKEADTLFGIIDAGGNGTLSVAELRDALREGAPHITLEEFWQRFANQWPNIAEATKGGSRERREAADRLSEVLPSHLRGTRDAPLLCLTAEAFDALCHHLDIGFQNGAELFSQCKKAAHCHGGQPLAAHEDRRSQSKETRLGQWSFQKECDLEDFFGVLRLWLDHHQDVMQHLGGVRVKLHALKALLAPNLKKKNKGSEEGEVEEEHSHDERPESLSMRHLSALQTRIIRGRWRS